MANRKHTRRTLAVSVISLIVCLAMFVGTTFAWFTDNVTSTNNIIKSGTLDVALDYKSAGDTEWKDASSGAIFNYQHWEPGYTEYKNIKITNKGTLAFKFQLNILANITTSAKFNLADVIDVYMFENSIVPTREQIAAATPVGTLASLMADPDGAAYGVILPADGVASQQHADSQAPIGSAEYTIVLKMQESAGNDYQDLKVGEGFSVQLMATQYTWEKDSFDETYDNGSAYQTGPVANVTDTGAKTVTATAGMGGQAEDIALDTSFAFQPSETLEQAQAGEYRYWHADFVVKADDDVAADSMALAGYYAAFCDDYNNKNWVALTSSDPISAGTEVRLVQAMGNGSISVNYEEICRYGNDGIGFLCGAADLNGSNAGTTITVELRLYETEEPSDANNNSHNVETGKYITISSYEYTF